MGFRMVVFMTRKILKKNKFIHSLMALGKCDRIFPALFVNELFLRSVTANYKKMLVIFDPMFDV